VPAERGWYSPKSLSSRANAGPRRFPCRRSRARHRTDGAPAPDTKGTASLAPILGAARTMEGAAAAAPLETTARAAAQRIQSDSAPHCTWSSSALCWPEETGTSRQERTGWAAASRNQIRAQAGSSPGEWCSMPTELMEEGVGMAAIAEDSPNRPQIGATQGRLWNRPITTTE
jgi:hypothetical protein